MSGQTNLEVEIVEAAREEVDVIENVIVMGSGNFGTCLANHLAELRNNVTIWSRNKDTVDSINNHHINNRYLKNIPLSEALTSINQITGELLNQTTVIVFCIPTQHLREILTNMKPFLKPSHLLIFANKGIEMGTLCLPFSIVTAVLGTEFGNNSVFLSGPSFASEVIQKQPTAVSVASKNIQRAEWAQRVFHSPFFRVYTSEDVIGVEIAGALKNVIAIASGICTGVGYMLNSRAAILTRGLAEITRIGVASGANPLTFSGLSGIGDLFLTCTSEKSRNFTVGYRLGKGEKLEDIIATLGSVAEGVPTAKAAYEKARQLNVSTPITDEVYAILYKNKSTNDALRTLLERRPVPEFQLPPRPTHIYQH